MSDTPMGTLAQLDIDNPEPYVYICRNGKDKVTFPNPGSMGMEEGEELLEDMVSKSDVKVVLPKWVGEEGFEKIRSEKWTLAEKNAVMRAAFLHYSEIFGSVGESDASATS